MPIWISLSIFQVMLYVLAMIYKVKLEFSFLVCSISNIVMLATLNY